VAKFQKGQSGNPGGRATELPTKIRKAHEDDAAKIMQVFVDVAMGLEVPGYEDAKPSDRQKCGAYVCDQVLGKPKQQIDGDINVGISPEQAAVLAAIQLTPHERRKRLAEIAAEDEAALAEEPAAEIVID
jgi:hypothetical protein